MKSCHKRSFFSLSLLCFLSLFPKQFSVAPRLLICPLLSLPTMWSALPPAIISCCCWCKLDWVRIKRKLYPSRPNSYRYGGGWRKLILLRSIVFSLSIHPLPLSSHTFLQERDLVILVLNFQPATASYYQQPALISESHILPQCSYKMHSKFINTAQELHSAEGERGHHGGQPSRILKTTHHRLTRVPTVNGEKKAPRD